MNGRTFAAAAFALTTVAVALGAGVGARDARADTPPSTWEMAKSPAARDHWLLHVVVHRRLEPEVIGLRGPSEEQLEEARLLLEKNGAAQSGDPLLLFDLGDVYEAQGRYDAARQILEEGLRIGPHHPSAYRAWLTLAYAYARLDDAAHERDAYLHFLEGDAESSTRSTVTLNLAESEMRLGRLEDAVAGYRETIRTTSGRPTLNELHTNILATWGLAIALDRSGDPQGAAQEAARAQRMDVERVIEDKKNVFFVPPYERLWYVALGETEVAKATGDPHAALLHWRRVEQLWTTYVEMATKSPSPDRWTDRWIPLAKAHQQQAKRQREAAESRAAKAPKPPPVPQVLTF